jgi:hypothetical protein
MVWGPFSMFHQGLLMNSLLVRLFVIVVNYAVGSPFIEVLIFYAKLYMSKVFNCTVCDIVGRS